MEQEQKSELNVDAWAGLIEEVLRKSTVKSYDTTQALLKGLQEVYERLKQMDGTSEENNTNEEK